VERFDRDEILRSVDLPALLDELTGQSASGRNGARWHCLEPNHPDAHPSVTVRIDEHGIGRWRCWSGGHGGTAVDALLAARGMSIREALEELACRAGANPSPLVRTPPRRPTERSPDGAVLRHVERCAEILWSERGRPVLEWLTEERGIPEAVLVENLVGCDPGRRWLNRPRGLPGRGIGAIFPALDPAGGVQYFQIRYVEDRPGRDRYENPATAMAANPRLSWVITPMVTAADVLVVAEGMPDAYTAAAAGFPAVGVLGAASPDARVADALVRQRAGRRLVLAFDAGNQAGTGNDLLRDLLIERGAPVKTIEVPPDIGDLNAWARHDRSWSSYLLGERQPPSHQPEPSVPAVGLT
jgi:DNA primase